MAVVQSHDYHSEVQQVGDDREEGRLLAAMLCRGRREGAADLAVQSSTLPKPPGLVEEVGHRRIQTAEPGASTHNNGVVIGEVFDLRHRSRLVELEVRLACDLLGDKLRHSLDIHLCTGFSCAFGHHISHRFDMAVGGIVKHQNLCHVYFLYVRCWHELFGRTASQFPKAAAPAVATVWS